MSDTITYLFGAGASNNSLPITKQIPNEIEKFIKELKNMIFMLSDSQIFDGLNLQISKRELQRELYDTLEWIKIESEKNDSIDIFAKKLFTRNKKKPFIKLKAGLICFFVYLQFKNEIDNRYNKFIAEIIDKNRGIYNLPNNLKILTWNYDFQFEKAYMPYCSFDSLYDIQILLNVQPCEISSFSDNDRFKIFKLNGTTATYDVYYSKLNNIENNLNRKIDRAFIELLVKSYTKFTYFHDQYQPIYSFAWENNKISEQVIKDAISATKNTKELVVIGYSFPNLNREIDRNIIKSMEKLEKVTIQAPGDDANEYVDKFKDIKKYVNNIEFKTFNNVSNFYLSQEL